MKKMDRDSYEAALDSATTYIMQLERVALAADVVVHYYESLGSDVDSSDGSGDSEQLIALREQLNNLENTI